MVEFSRPWRSFELIPKGNNLGWAVAELFPQFLWLTYTLGNPYGQP